MANKLQKQHLELLKTELVYQPYNGGGGPTSKQTLNNTLYFKQLLDKEKIENTLDYEYAKKLWGGDEVQIRITGTDLVVGMDRWGYVVDGPVDIDQDSSENTIKAIKNYLKK